MSPQYSYKHCQAQNSHAWGHPTALPRPGTFALPPTAFPGRRLPQHPYSHVSDHHSSAHRAGNHHSGDQAPLCKDLHPGGLNCVVSTVVEAAGVGSTGEHHGDVVVPTVVVTLAKTTSFEAAGVETTMPSCHSPSHPHCPRPPRTSLCPPHAATIPSSPVPVLPKYLPLLLSEKKLIQAKAPRHSSCHTQKGVGEVDVPSSCRSRRMPRPHG